MNKINMQYVQGQMCDMQMRARPYANEPSNQSLDVVVCDACDASVLPNLTCST